MRSRFVRTVVALAVSATALTATQLSRVDAQPLAQAGPARAAASTTSTPIKLVADGGEKPQVAVSSDGTAHVVWLQSTTSGGVGHYCRLPRGATACDRTSTLTAADGSSLNAFGVPQVLLDPDGNLVVLAGFCCGGNDADLVMWRSADGGQTFGAPQQIGTQIPESAVFGPSDNAITVGFGGSSSPPAASVQVAEIDAPAGQWQQSYALLGDPDASQYYSGGVGLLDSLTPMTAYTDLDNTYLRVFDATRTTSELNSADAWLPPIEVTGESDPSLVSGAAGTYLMTYYNYSGNVLDGAYRVRRITPDDSAPSGISLSAPVLGSDPGGSLFGAITADAGDASGNDGGLTTVWTDTGNPAAIKSAYAAGGGQFRAPGTLVAAANAANLEVATAGDGGGAVVWDENGEGAVWLAPIPAGGVPSDAAPTPTHDGGFTPPGNTKKCTTSLTVRPGVVAAVRGGLCWTQVSGQTWTTKGDVNVNGIDFITDKASTSVRVDLASDKLTATAGVLQKAGSLVFAKDAGTWDLGGTTIFEGVEKANIKLFDFPVMGRASVVFKSGKAEVTANLGLPKPFDFFNSLPVTVQTVLTTTQQKGLILTGITARAEHLSVGGFSIDDLKISYDAGLSEFVGEAKLDLAGTKVEVGLGFAHGKLTKLYFTYRDGAPFPISLGYGIWLNGVGFGYDGTDGFALAGGGLLSFPVPTTVTASPPIEIDGLGSPPGTGAGFVFKRSGGVTAVTIAATLKIFGFNVGNSSAYLDTTGVLTFSSNLDVGWDRLGLHGSFDGGVDAGAGTWHAVSEGEACLLLCASMKAAASNVGIGACASIDLWLTSIGITVGYNWKSGLYASFGCDLGPFLNPPAQGSGGPGQLTVSSNGTVEIPANNSDTPRSFVIDIPGAGGVPLVTVRDGQGSVLVASDPNSPDEPQQNDPYVLTPSPATNSTRLLVLKRYDPLPTTIRIESSPQSRVAIMRRPATFSDDGRRAVGESALTVAEIVGDTDVTASVAGKARARTLSYRASHVVDGSRSVVFVEHAGNGLAQEIGTATANSGKLAFRALEGPAGKRQITATVVNSDGVPVRTTQVATYTAPGWVRAGKASKAKVRHTAKGAVIAWRAPSGAARPARWQVFVRLASGEGRLVVTKKPTLTIKGAQAKGAIRVVITGLDKQGRPGAAVRAKG